MHGMWSGDRGRHEKREESPAESISIYSVLV